MRGRSRRGLGLGLGLVDFSLGLGDQRTEGLVVDDLGALCLREHEPDDEAALERVVCAREASNIEPMKEEPYGETSSNAQKGNQ